MINLRRLSDQTAAQKHSPGKFSFESSYLEDLSSRETDDWNIVEFFHENTKYKHDQYNNKLSKSQHRFNEDPNFAYLQARIEPDYPTKELIDLPEAGSLDQSLETVLQQRRSKRDMTGGEINLQDLSTLLQHSCGVNGARELEFENEETVTQTFRTYPSGGALYPVEIYLLVMNRTESLIPGVYYYLPERHALRVIKRDQNLPEKVADLFELFEGSAEPSTSAVTFVLSGQFWRPMAKYGPRCYRNVLQESGHLAQNILLTATAMDLASVPIAAYRDDALNEYLDIDGIEEAVLYSVCVGEDAGDEV